MKIMILVSNTFRTSSFNFYLNSFAIAEIITRLCPFSKCSWFFFSQNINWVFIFVSLFYLCHFLLKRVFTVIIKMYNFYIVMFKSRTKDVMKLKKKKNINYQKAHQKESNFSKMKFDLNFQIFSFPFPHSAFSHYSFHSSFNVEKISFYVFCTIEYNVGQIMFKQFNCRT